MGSIDQPVPKPPSNAPPARRAPRPLRVAQTKIRTSASSKVSAGSDGSDFISTTIPKDFQDSNYAEGHAPPPLLSRFVEDEDEEDEQLLEDELLLEWSKKLDFNTYMENWQKTATTDGSDGTLPI